MDEALRAKRIVRLRADMTDENPEAAALLEELGNVAKSIPFVAVYSWTDPDKPFTLADVFTRETLLKVLEQVAPSKPAPPTVAQAQGGVLPAPGTNGAASEPSDSQDETAQAPEASGGEHEANADDVWRPFSVEKVKALRSRGIPLVVDWTADW